MRQHVSERKIILAMTRTRTLCDRVPALNEASEARTVIDRSHGTGRILL